MKQQKKTRKMRKKKRTRKNHEVQVKENSIVV